jgi:hypothetical protein
LIMDSSKNSEANSFFHETVSYVTDIEGNWNFWDRFVRMSDVLKLIETVNEFTGRTHREIILKEHCHLVFGGDVCDRGPGDMRVVRELLELKEEYPDHVHFILGNRDVNKLRLAVELDDCMLSCAGKVYWIDTSSGGETGLTQFELAAASGTQNAVDRLKWILKSTMGSPGAFEYRRQELALEGRAHEDMDIVRSYTDWVHPITGELFQFIKHGKIAWIIGDTLYVHGALKPSNIGWVPPMRGENPSGRVVQDLREWVNAINDWHQSEVADYEENFDTYMDILRRERRVSAVLSNEENGNYILQTWAVEGGYANLMPGSRLLQYGK